MAKRRSGSNNSSNKPKSKPVTASKATGSKPTGRAKGSPPPERKKAVPARKAKAKTPGTKTAAAKKIRPKRKPRSRNESVPIVGIGASAGGLEAFTQLLGALPADTGMAFVMVSHLSHTHKSMLTELLAKATSMPVSQVTETTLAGPNHVYVIPPNMNLAITDRVIAVSPMDKARHSPMAIDFFFRSLAKSRGSGAIGVLLSGTGSDGTLGLAAIKAEGGITFVQDEGSARYADMPRSAVRAGSADFVLSPQQIAAELARIARHPYVVETRGGAAVEDDSPPRDGLSQIFELIRAATGVDFSFYKPTTIRRRVSRRMLLHKIDKTEDYVTHLRANPGELGALYQDLLINVTGFFRDPDVFEFLQQQIIPKLALGRSVDTPIRVWIPGCATGEEAYSVAICLLEALGDYGPNPPLQVFSTDISEIAIKRAREGFYPENIALDVSPERLRRFFVKTESGYRISKMVRDLCVFASQNLVKDPPFSRMDLISCRNVLIYLGTPLQRRALVTFHYALKPGGFLMLGHSETTTAAGELFEQVSKRQKVYLRLPTPARLTVDLFPAGPDLAVRAAGRKAGGDEQPPDISREADRMLLSRYSPPGVIVNSALEIVQFRGHTSRYLEPSPGEASLNLFRMARQGLVIDLRAAIHQARRSEEPARKEGLQIQANGDVRTVNLEVVPLGGGKGLEGYYLVLFEEAAGLPEASQPGARSLSRRRGSGSHSKADKELEALRKELAATQEDLHAIIEEQEASNEELQSANEEILSANEELQSTNEEMETAKEELEATNEELTTVNDELQNRNAELTQAHNDLQNLISVSEMVMVMVGHDLRIRRITPAAQRVLNLIAADIGRPLSNIKTNLRLPNLESIIREAIDTITATEMEVQDQQGQWHAMRIRPYRTEENKIDGAVMVLVDIDAVKRGSESESVWRTLVEQVPDFILSAEPEGKVLFINRTVASLAQSVSVGENIYDFVDAREHVALKRCLSKAIASGTPASFSGSAKVSTEVTPIKSHGSVVALTITTRRNAG